jgi:hypothetical protein
MVTRIRGGQAAAYRIVALRAPSPWLRAHRACSNARIHPAAGLPRKINTKSFRRTPHHPLTKDIRDAKRHRIRTHRAHHLDTFLVILMDVLRLAASARGCPQTFGRG